jgi:two-component system, NarL family, response regulator DevR
MTRVMVVDDHEIVRIGLRELINRHFPLELVGEAGSIAEALKKFPLLKPEIVILDVRLPDGSGVEACRKICHMETGAKVVMLTSFPDDEDIVDCILAGASAYILKDIQGNSLVKALEEVTRGKMLLDPSLSGNVFNVVRRTKQKECAAFLLTLQEEKIVSLVAEGKTNREIGESLFLSEKTVRNHLTRILRKLNLNNRTQAAAYYSKMRSS